MKTEIAKIWDTLIDLQVTTDDSLKLVTCINGYNLETMEAVLFALTGYRTLEQFNNS